ncbi:hypothetical protein JOC93_000006 [Priestia taiwanensis]|uniref:Uncharacterized protein n=1 Tax=Priestia taiwanensis TaxID=1347902 RepID=A0A917EKJ0_9BACI|nr:hypothetical protein [Priestia taiwanensis]GGE53724.1 hypothetical protein GCM10007140_00050 [Priestia taiwanensis]
MGNTRTNGRFAAEIWEKTHVLRVNAKQIKKMGKPFHSRP